MSQALLSAAPRARGSCPLAALHFPGAVLFENTTQARCCATALVFCYTFPWLQHFIAIEPDQIKKVVVDILLVQHSRFFEILR